MNVVHDKVVEQSEDPNKSLTETPVDITSIGYLQKLRLLLLTVL